MDKNLLYFGDNLEVLRHHIKDDTVDLVYLDPPFNSNASYNILFAEQDGTRAASQIKAFGDTWQWDEAAARLWDETVAEGGKVADALQAFWKLLGPSNMMAYVVMMAPRLVELRRVLKPTGSIYLHCDPTASHYLKLLMDAVFGPQNYINEITWKRAHTVKGNFGQGGKMWGRNTDSILFYGRTGQYTFHQQFAPYSDGYLAAFYKYVEPDTDRRYRLISMIGPGGAAKGNPEYEVMGVTRFWRYSRERMQSLIDAGLVVQTKPGTVPVRKQYLDEGSGVANQALWDDIPALGPQQKERLGYPTQKPLTLLERIIQASSNPGDVVLDPFCGCGTAVVAAEKLSRRWIGIDVAWLAIALIKRRLVDSFPENPIPEIFGEPTALPEARALAAQDKFQFQYWVVEKIVAHPVEHKKGADRGIDGRFSFYEGPQERQEVVLSVKGGEKVTSEAVREFAWARDREGAAIGALITLNDPTSEMVKEATTSGYYESKTWGKKYPRLQLLTVKDLLAGKEVQCPPRRNPYKEAAWVKKDQDPLF